MRKLSRLALGALYAGALALPASAEDGVTDSEILLGSHTALSGPVSAWGIGSTEGMRMRFEEANEKGINGRKIKFIVEDHQYQVPRAVQAANKLINNDKIFAMVGALGTPQNNAVLGEQLGKGVPNLGRRGRGDLLVTIVVETPKPGSKDERRLIEELADLRGESSGGAGRLRRSFEP